MPERRGNRSNCGDRTGASRTQNRVHKARRRFKALSINANCFAPIETNSTPIPFPAVALRTTASSFNSPSTIAKINFSAEPTATMSSVTMKAPEALKSNTREVCLLFSNFHDTHIPEGVDTRRFFLLSGADAGLDPGSLLSALNFNNISRILWLAINFTLITELLTPSSSHYRELIIKFPYRPFRALNQALVRR